MYVMIRVEISESKQSIVFVEARYEHVRIQ